MPYYLVGDLVKKLRIQRGMTQEELSNGILSKTNLSRLESGVQIPHKEKLDAILQRLGVDSQETCSYYLNEKDYEMSKKCDHLMNLISNKKYLDANIIINELSLLSDFSEGIKAQFLLFCKASIMVNFDKNNYEVKKLVLEALEITIPYYSERYISSYFLTDQEVRLINLLSIIYYNENNMNKAIEVLEKLKEALDSSRIDESQKSKLYPFILYNLSKYYGLNKKYLESIKICDYAKNICVSTNNLRLLPSIIYNKAYCLYELGYKEECKNLIYQVYYTFDIMEEYDKKNVAKNYAKENLGIVFT